MLHSHALPKQYNFVLVTTSAVHTHIPSPPPLTISSTSFPEPLVASSARNVFLPLLVNCDPTLKTSSNVNSEISSFLGISSPYPQAELSSSLLCTPLTLAFAYTNVALDTSHYYKIYVVLPVPLVLYFPACVHLLY